MALLDRVYSEMYSKVKLFIVGLKLVQSQAHKDLLFPMEMAENVEHKFHVMCVS